MAGTTQKMEFQAEVRQVLDIVIHSLYTHKDVFLRELISNASDALDRRRFEALTRTELAPEKDEYWIRLEPDRERRTLTVRDNGMGMSREELVLSLGTIARSGTQEFLRTLRSGRTGSAPELIGQFGVGFYSAFMVADTVEVLTRKAGEDKAWLWRSQGEGGFTVEESPVQGVEAGTAVKVSLKKREEGDTDYVEPEELRRIVKKYSDFITHPIRLQGADDAINSMKAIWTKPAKEISAEEHAEFYRRIAHDFAEPLEPIRFSAEGTSFRYDALLYIPSKSTLDLLFPERRSGLALYVKRVLIAADCKDLTPDYLRFVRGVVDCPDLPLNISRETMQHDRQVRRIRESVVRKTLDALSRLQTEDREKYLRFWKAFGKVLKEGLYSDPDSRERIQELLQFETTATAPGELCSLKDYADRMKADQKEIYFIAGESRQAVESSPHLEALKAKGYEVIFFTDPVDEVVADSLRELGGKPFRCAGKGSLGLEPDAQTREKAEDAARECAGLLDFMRETLADHVKEVRFSERLTESAVCLVSEEGAVSARLEKMLRQVRQEEPQGAKRILELNPLHPVVERMRKMFEEDRKDPRIAEYAELLYGQGVLTEGSPLPDPARYAKLVAKLMV